MANNFKLNFGIAGSLQQYQMHRHRELNAVNRDAEYDGNQMHRYILNCPDHILDQVRQDYKDIQRELAVMDRNCDQWLEEEKQFEKKCDDFQARCDDFQARCKASQQEWNKLAEELKAYREENDNFYKTIGNECNRLKALVKASFRSKKNLANNQASGSQKQKAMGVEYKSDTSNSKHNSGAMSKSFDSNNYNSHNGYKYSERRYFTDHFLQESIDIYNSYFPRYYSPYSYSRDYNYRDHALRDKSYTKLHNTQRSYNYQSKGPGLYFGSRSYKLYCNPSVYGLKNYNAFSKCDYRYHLLA